MPSFPDGDAFILRARLAIVGMPSISPPAADPPLVLKAAGGQAVLTIRDHGPGVPEYAREKIFERFYSLRHHAAGRKGTGLGLTLVRETADLHGGSITLEPAEGGGSIAKLVLPTV